jgi:ribonuclease PH
MNIVMNEEGHFIEVQGTAEENYFTRMQLDAMLEMAEAGIQQIIALQKNTLEN